VKTGSITKFGTFISQHKLAAILTIGIIIRLILMPITAHPFDVYAWYNLSQSIVSDGFTSLQIFPPYHIMLVSSAYLYSWLSTFLPTGTIAMSTLPSALDFYPTLNVLYVPGLLFNFVVKIPFLVSDVLVAFLLYKIVGEFFGGKGLAEKAVLLWFLNPMLIWISAGWGMWDTLPVLFSLAAFYLLLRGKFEFSAICLSIGVALKFYPLLFLVPIVFYLLKTSAVKARLRNSLRFFGVFAAVMMVLILPYIHLLPNFFLGFIFPNSAGVATAVADPIVNPIGFGLSYWSVYLLNRFASISLTADIIYALSIFSITLVLTSLLLVYRKTSKLTFKKPFLDLNLAMFLTLAALFLFFRFICEQWFVWILPFLIILYIAGRVKGIHYWMVTLAALFYAIINCPLPFFFLSLTPWIGHGLVGMGQVSLSAELVRIVMLVMIGCLFSSLLLYISYRSWDKKYR